MRKNKTGNLCNGKKSKKYSYAKYIKWFKTI